MDMDLVISHILGICDHNVPSFVVEKDQVVALGTVGIVATDML
jgi:hypothetical protein